MIIIESATEERIQSMLPKAAKVIHYDDDGYRLFIAYEINGVSYKTTIKSTSCGPRMANKK